MCAYIDVIRMWLRIYSPISFTNTFSYRTSEKVYTYLRTLRINFTSFLDCFKNIGTLGMLSNCIEFISKDFYLITVIQNNWKSSIQDPTQRKFVR